MFMLSLSTEPRSRVSTKKLIYLRNISSELFQPGGWGGGGGGGGAMNALYITRVFLFSVSTRLYYNFIPVLIYFLVNIAVTKNKLTVNSRTMKNS